MGDLTIPVLLYFYRGDGFCQEFSRLGEVQSENVMALTATASNAMRAAIIKCLDRQKPIVVSVPPFKDNIVYAVGVNKVFD